MVLKNHDFIIKQTYNLGVVFDHEGNLVAESKCDFMKEEVLISKYTSFQSGTRLLSLCGMVLKGKSKSLLYFYLTLFVFSFM